MKRILSASIVFIFALAACSSPTSTRPTSTPTSTPRGSAALSQPATLYSGPGNINYTKLAELPAGTTIALTGLYGDFVQATVSQAGTETTGFIRQDSIQDIPGGLPTLGRLQVPWEPMYLPECAPGEYVPETDSVTFSGSTSDSFMFSPESAVWSLEAPVRVQITKLVSSDHGSVQVLGRPAGAVSRDNWWQGLMALVLESMDGNYVLRIYDGTSEQSVALIDLERSTSDPIQVVFDQPEGRSFAVLDENNQELQHVDVTTLSGVNLPSGLFPERNFYFGVTAPNNSSLIVTGLMVGTEPEGKWMEQSDIGPGLVSLGEERGLPIGTWFVLERMIDRRYCQAMQRDFNLVIVGEFSLLPPPFWLGPGQYDFGRMDRIVAFAHRRGWRVFASHLVWGDPGAIPEWLRNGSFTRDEYISILEQHIRTVVGRYRGQVQEWSVANEAIERLYWNLNNYYTTSSHDFWYEKIGPEYVEMSFRWAREADPDAILIFNSGANAPPYNRLSQTAINMMVETVQDFRTRGVPIDGVGMQLHLLGPGGDPHPPQKAELLETMRRFADLGVGIYITELEVDLGSRLGTQDERYAFQAQVYRDVMDACLESGACRGFYTWGTSDSLSWITCSLPAPICLNEPNGDPLLFDRDFNPKPAYFAVSDALAGLPAAPTPTGAATGGELVTPVPPTPDPNAVSNMYDDFDNTAYDGAFDPSKWRRSGSSPNPQVAQQNGALAIVDASDDYSGDVTLTARAYDGIMLDEAMFIEASLTVAYDSAAGSVMIRIASSDPTMGTWMTGCGIERYSSRFRGNCSDFVWTQQASHSYETPRQDFELGSWHRFRIELDPPSMTITYIIDGVVAGSHILEDAGRLRNARFQFSIGTWKSSIYYPLAGFVSYVSIGQTER